MSYNTKVLLKFRSLFSFYIQSQGQRCILIWQHNDANGEGGNDGSNDNFSWNCGTEGKL